MMASTIYCGVARSAAEYGRAVYGVELSDANAGSLELLQLLSFAKHATGCHGATPAEAVRAEADWMELAKRRRNARLAVYHRVLRLDDDHPVQVLRREREDGLRPSRFFPAVEEDWSRIFDRDCLRALGQPGDAFKLAMRRLAWQEADADWAAAGAGKHLRRVKPTARPWRHAEEGARATTTTLARFRCDWNGLADTARRLGRGTGACPHCIIPREDRDHFLLHCVAWLPERHRLICKLVDAGVDPPETEPPLTCKLLLGGERLPRTKQRAVLQATVQFAQETERFGTANGEHSSQRREVVQRHAGRRLDTLAPPAWRGVSPRPRPQQLRRCDASSRGRWQPTAATPPRQPTGQPCE